MIVCIAEKPSVARDIADVLGAKEKKDGYIEGNGYQVTWTFGHLCTLKEPHEYTPNWKSWSLGSLPMIPPRFGIKLISNPTYERQFHTIENLMQHADMIINCGDAGQEGELIQRWVMQKAGARCPVKRLWISSLTEEAIREGFAKLRDASDFQPLYEAGLSRAIGDWLLGMNATRLYTMKYGQNRQVLSIGRVQTPTLALIVNRQLEIQNFVPKQYWELKTVYRDTTFSAILRKSEEELVLEAEKQKEAIAAGKKPKKEEENRGIDPITDREEALRCNMFYVNERWLGGMLTNFKTIQTRINRLRKLEAMEADGTFDVLPKKEVIGLRLEMEKLTKYLGGIKDMKKLPGALFIVDPRKENIAVLEARKLNIPIVATVDTNCDPDVIDHVIPANDDAIRAVKLLTAKMADAVLEGRQGMQMEEAAEAEEVAAEDAE